MKGEPGATNYSCKRQGEGDSECDNVRRFRGSKDSGRRRTPIPATTARAMVSKPVDQATQQTPARFVSTRKQSPLYYVAPDDREQEDGAKQSGEVTTNRLPEAEPRISGGGSDATSPRSVSGRKPVGVHNQM